MDKLHMYETWGKDHWSTLAYVESCSVDSRNPEGIASLDLRRMRCNRNKHPLVKANGFPWDKSNGTIIKGGKILKDHDDWDCLEDLEKEGLVEVISLVNGYVKLTDKGIKIAHQLREHKAKGGQFSTFTPSSMG